jgi:cytochrome P450
MANRLAPPPGSRTHHEVQRDLWEVARPVAEDRRANPVNDAMSLLVKAQAEHPEIVTDELIMDMLLHLLTGGFHTTQHLIEQLLSHLADDPALWTRMRADRSLIDAAIEEMLRWDAPVQALKRRAVVDVELHGVTIPAGSVVGLVFGSANRDERAFPDPDVFDVDRDAKKHLAFSVGIHLCPGAPVTRFEVRELVAEMLDRYPVIERAAPSEHYPDGRHRGWQRVPLRLRRGG